MLVFSAGVLVDQYLAVLPNSPVLARVLCLCVCAIANGGIRSENEVKASGGLMIKMKPHHYYDDCSCYCYRSLRSVNNFSGFHLAGRLQWVRRRCAVAYLANDYRMLMQWTSKLAAATWQCNHCYHSSTQTNSGFVYINAAQYRFGSLISCVLTGDPPAPYQMCIIMQLLVVLASCLSGNGVEGEIAKRVYGCH